MDSSNARRVIAAGAIGNVLEWYDFAIYGYFAAAIGQTFFPKEDAVAQILSAFGIFAVGYLVRQRKTSDLEGAARLQAEKWLAEASAAQNANSAKVPIACAGLVNASPVNESTITVWQRRIQLLRRPRRSRPGSRKRSTSGDQRNLNE